MKVATIIFAACAVLLSLLALVTPSLPHITQHTNYVTVLSAPTHSQQSISRAAASTPALHLLPAPSFLAPTSRTSRLRPCPLARQRSSENIPPVLLRRLWCSEVSTWMLTSIESTIYLTTEIPHRLVIRLGSGDRRRGIICPREQPHWSDIRKLPWMVEPRHDYLISWHWHRYWIGSGFEHSYPLAFLLLDGTERFWKA